MSIKQEQSSGDESVNLQAGRDITVGISYSDAKSIALDVYYANALQLSNVAKEVAEKRVKEFIDNFLKKLFSEKPESIKKFRDPDMQYAIFTAQEGCARSSEKEIEDLLIDVLLERVDALAYFHFKRKTNIDLDLSTWIK